MYMTAMPSSLFSRSMLPKMVARNDASTIETGSSATMILGLSNNALATMIL